MGSGIRTGVTLRGDVPGHVSEYEIREAARHSLIPWPHWLAMDRVEQLATLAYYRLHRMVEMFEADAIRRHQESESRRAAARNNGSGRRRIPRSRR